MLIINLNLLSILLLQRYLPKDLGTGTTIVNSIALKGVRQTSHGMNTDNKALKFVKGFLSDPGVPGPIYGSECLQLRHLFADLTDVTDEDTDSIFVLF